MASERSDDVLAEACRLLFAGDCAFIFGTAKAAELPEAGPPEIAFAGRSNVGKSSLINALTNRKALARTSHTPGRTQELNFFALGLPERLRLVDMPGYGYAAVSKEKSASWQSLMRDFLRGRATLARVFVLIDGRHGLKPIDAEMLDALDQAAVSYQVVLTKADELTPAAQAKIVSATELALRPRPAAFPQVLLVSSRTGVGIETLRTAIMRLMAERGQLV